MRGCALPPWQVDEDATAGQSFVELQFSDGETRKVLTAGKTIQDIARIIERKGDEMELRGVFKEVRGSSSAWQAGRCIHTESAASCSMRLWPLARSGAQVGFDPWKAAGAGAQQQGALGGDDVMRAEIR